MLKKFGHLAKESAELTDKRSWATEYIFYCKRPILFLSSSKILTRRVCPPPATNAGGTHSPGGEGDGGSKFWKNREIGLPSYSNGLSTSWAL
jgi:hypothetical protein